MSSNYLEPNSIGAFRNRRMRWRTRKGMKQPFEYGILSETKQQKQDDQCSESTIVSRSMEQIPANRFREAAVMFLLKLVY
mmetsp:Transcript_14005/g.35229  ORF Transcript_14005/g.35229 Transcript_14005/m.35229 type:complete len:80 (+) Transcript_14005:2505-2744(+)